MGHLINPISTRLAFSAFWLSSWTDYSIKNFSYNLMLDKGLMFLLDWAFVHSSFAQSLTKIGIFLSHYRLMRRGNKFRAHFFLVYNSSLILKSSFVESSINALPVDWAALWIKKNLPSKLKLRNFNLLAQSFSTLKSSTKPAHLVLGSLETLIKNQQKGSFSASVKSFSGSTTARRESFRQRGLANKSFLIQKKIILNKILNLLNFFFSEIVSSLFSQFVFKSNQFKNLNGISVGVKFLDNFNIVNPQFIARFIARRVSYGFQLQRVLKPLIRDLNLAMSKKRNKIIGFRIACSGRFDRKQIASYIWQKFGPVSLNKFSTAINYGFATAYLKYGTCGIKVWIASKHQPLSSQFKNKTSLFGAISKLKLLDKADFDVFSFQKIITVIKLFESYQNCGGLINKLRIKAISKGDFNFINASKGVNEFFLRNQLLVNSWLKYENKALASKRKHLV